MSRKLPNFSEIMSVNGTAKHFFEFDEFRVEVEERRLLHAGRPVTLASRDFDVLLALVQNFGQTIDKNDLMETVWEDTFVEEGNLNRHVSTLRRVLGDDPREQRFIKTIPKRGYRFTSDVREIVEQAETVSLENVSRSRVVITEETTEGFWTWPKLLVAAAVFGIVLVAGLGLYNLATSASGGRVESSAILQEKKPDTASSEAYDAYITGRHYWNKRTAADMREAVRYFQIAVDIDPDYAKAYAGLADAYLLGGSPEDTPYSAKDLAEKALALDDTLAEAHAARAYYLSAVEWDWAEAERAFQRAVELNPDYATARHWYAYHLASTDKPYEAMNEIRAANRIDPDSLIISTDVCHIYYLAGLYPFAIEQCRKVIESDPNFAEAHLRLGETYLQVDMFPEAIAEFQKASALGKNVKGQLGYAYAVSGRHEDARKILAEFEEDGRKGTLRSYAVVLCTYAALGNRERAFHWLEMAYKMHSGDLALIRTDPKFESLRSDPRFQDILRRMKLG